MSQNFIRRAFTSIILLFLLFLVTFSNKYIFIFTIIILGVIICIEANNIFQKLLKNQLLKKKIFNKKLNKNFLILNLITFCYIFFVFCNLAYEIHNSKGALFFLYLISICFFTDIGGYLFGKTIGGKKLSKISPNKTISGMIGSFMFSMIPLILFQNLGYLDLRFNLNNIIFCLLISLISQLGDLLISYFKRKAKVKDTGKLLPGHGGVLDRLDGIIFAIPFSYFLLIFIK